jgi:AbrB family looped-hinge helix DNA binding protein
MTTVTVSSKYQIVIPRSIRDALRIKAGARLHAIAYRGRLELVPLLKPSQARGLARGIDSDVPRDPDRA